MDANCRLLDSSALAEAQEALGPLTPAARALHAAVLDGAVGRMAADHLLAFARQLPMMGTGDAVGVAKATAALISAALALNGADNEDRPADTATAQRIRRYIDDNLESDELTPGVICDRLAVSRSTLNRAFAAEGGIAAYIRFRRLDAIRALLEDAAERRSMADIAYGFGFVSDAHFSRAFRQQFGYSPREARLRGAASRAEAPAPASPGLENPPGEAPRKVPVYGIDLAQVAPRDREAAWRIANGAHFDMQDLPAGLMAQGRAWDFGLMVLTDSTHQRQTYVRDAVQARRDGVDHLLISTELDTGFQLETERGHEMVPPGRITLCDTARPQRKLAFAGRTICLAMSRDLVDEVLPGIEMNGLTLGPLGRLLVEHLKSMTDHAHGLEMSAAGAFTGATAQLLAACVRPNGERVEQARPLMVQALLQSARRYVRAHCCDPDLSPEKVACGIGASRTTLYRAFQPKGGISEYIRLSRLDAARAALADPRDLRRVSEIAYAHGFLSEAQFSRAIKASFGASPSELRHEGHDFRSGYAPDVWTQRGWLDETVAHGARRPGEAAPAWRPSAGAALARALNEERRGAA